MYQLNYSKPFINLHLSPKELLTVRRFNRKALILLLATY